MILEEFDPTQQAIINPEETMDPIPGLPKSLVSCFATETFTRMLETFGGEKIGENNVANTVIPVYKTIYKGKEIGLYQSDVGAPVCAALADELFAIGAEQIVIFGTCGVLDASIEDCSVILPDCAVRDEGTSYHYAPPSDEIRINEQHLTEVAHLLKCLDIHYTRGKTWTTDAFYRETPSKTARRKKQGCICVDMEASATAAVAQFRGKEIFHFFYAADNLDAEQWNLANTQRKRRHKSYGRSTLWAVRGSFEIRHLRRLSRGSAEPREI